MILEINSLGPDIDFAPANELEEIIQNVRAIVTTEKGTVPMYREFGISCDALDKPIASAQTLITSEIVAAVKKYEPRCNVVGAVFGGKEIEGKLNVKVQVKIDGL